MDFAFSEEQELLRASARDYLTDRFPIERVVELADGEAGWDPATWRQLAEMGWLDPELGMLEHAVLFEETGAALLPAPLFATVGLAWPLLDDELRAGVAAGERSVTVAWAEPGRRVRLGAPEAAETRADAQGRLTGHKVTVPDLTLVTDVLVVAADGVHAVDLTATPDAAVARSTVDRTRRLGELRLDATPARRVADLAELPRAARRALAALSNEAAGVGRRVLELAAEHTKTREQFGRVIGTYQAVSHQVADTYVATELARSLAVWAAWTVAEDSEGADLACAAAKSAAGEAAVGACERAIQVHGGLGFTWESPLHRYYKRAQWIEAFEGPAREHRARVAEAVLGA